MSVTRLDTAFLDGGLRSTNYFNGRILSREDMQRDSDAHRALHQRLGLALGDGIVRGFEVEAKSIGGSSITNPVVTVRPGLAINRLGQTLALDRGVDVALLEPRPASTGASIPDAGGGPAVGGFEDCLPPDQNVYVTGAGVYLLSVAPAQARQGLALVSGLGNEGASCNAKELVEGLQFRLSQVKALSNAELADAVRLRNVAAYKFFLAEGADLAAIRDPLGAAAAPPDLTVQARSECEVPLALLSWTATGGLRWVDRWAVRRRVAPLPAPDAMATAAGPRLLALGEAMRLQFQDEARDLRLGTTAPQLLVASGSFRYLPPAGVLPLFGQGASTGFDRVTFFSDRPTRGPIVMEGAEVPALLRTSLAYPPIDLTDHVVVWTYLVRENLQAQSQGIQPAFLFASGHVPPFGAARADVARAGFANTPIDF